MRVKKKNSMQLKAIAKQSNEKHNKVNQFDIKEEARRNNSSEFVLKRQQEEVQTHRCVEQNLSILMEEKLKNKNAISGQNTIKYSSQAETQLPTTRFHDELTKLKSSDQQNSQKSMGVGNNGEDLYRIYGGGKNIKNKFKLTTESLSKKRQSRDIQRTYQNATLTMMDHSSMQPAIVAP